MCKMGHEWLQTQVLKGWKMISAKSNITADSKIRLYAT